MTQNLHTICISNLSYRICKLFLLLASKYHFGIHTNILVQCVGDVCTMCLWSLFLCYLSCLLVHHVQLLFAEPRFHLCNVTVILLSMIHGV